MGFDLVFGLDCCPLFLAHSFKLIRKFLDLTVSSFELAFALGLFVAELKQTVAQLLNCLLLAFELVRQGHKLQAKLTHLCLKLVIRVGLAQ